MKNSSLTLTIAVLLSLGILSTAAQADDDIKEMEAISKGLGFITLEQASAKALAAKAGVIKDSDLENRKYSKGWDYEFKIVDAYGHE